MRPLQLTSFAVALNHILDKGYYEFSIEEIKGKIRDKSLFDYLEKKVSREDFLDLSVLNEKDRKELLGTFEDMVDNVNEDRKMGIQNNGLCLLLAYAHTLITQKIQETLRNNEDK